MTIQTDSSAPPTSELHEKCDNANASRAPSAYCLFIDDEREPVRADYLVVRSSAAAIETVLQRGMPVDISFDHDLGGDDTTMRFLLWLTDQLLDEKLQFPGGFCFSVHSQNPVGARNIKERMQSLLAHFPPLP